MMFSELYQYLLQHKEISVPGIGTFLLERNPAKADFPNKKILPPSFTIAMQPGGQLPGKGFFKWLAGNMNVSDREAIFRFNDFAFDLKKQLGEGTEVNWNQVGTLSKAPGGDVRFTAADTAMYERPVAGEKVIRQKAEHMVRVGEDEKTAAEMTELLNQPDEKRSYWWAYALVAGLLAIVFIGWHLSVHGVEPSSAANQQKINPVSASPSYNVLQ